MSRLPVEVHAAAEADVDEIAQTISRDNLDAALRFYEAIEATFEFLRDYPNVGTRRSSRDPKLAGLRSFGVRGFRNYLIFFLPQPDRVRVLRVLHAARDHDRLF